jgi:predicted DNA-binding transcriptional regulator AlpA
MPAVPESLSPMFVDEKRAAELIGMSISYLQRCRIEGIGPRARKIGRVVRYAVSDLVEWVESGRAATEHLSPPRRRVKGA